MGPGVQREISGLLARTAPELAACDAGNFAAGCLRLLTALRAMSSRLPANVSGTLRAVEQGPARSAESFQTQRERVLGGITRLADNRSYRDAPGLAHQLQAMIERHQDRLSPDDRALWVRLEREFRRTGDAEVYLRGVEQDLGEYRSLRRAIERAKTWHAVTARSIGPLPPARGFDVPPLNGALSRYRNRALVPGEQAGRSGARGPAEADGTDGPDSLLMRYANVHFPATVLASQRSIPLVVHLSIRHDPASRADAAASSAGIAPGEVVIVLHAEGFEINGSIGGTGALDRREVRSVTVAAAADAEPVIFFVSPQGLGKKRIAVDLYQSDRRLQTVAFTTEVVRELPGVRTRAGGSAGHAGRPVAVGFWPATRS